MDPSQWQQWLMSPRPNGWPTRVGELMPADLASCMAIDNGPGVRHPLDATGFLSKERLALLIEALLHAGSGEWMIAYWDGWSGIEPTLRETYGERPFRLRLPLRDYWAVQIGLDDLIKIAGIGTHPVFIGPSLLAANDRSVLVAGDVDWPTTYVGFASAAARAALMRSLESQGVSVETCDALSPLPGYSSTANPRENPA